MLLVPVGIINERHEPPVFHGVERPFVDTVIVPTTWFEAGAGVHGAFGRGFRYRAYAMAPLDATEFTRRGRAAGRRAARQRSRRAQRRRHRPARVRRHARAADRRQLLDGRYQLQRPADRDARSASTNSTRGFSRGRLEARGQFAHVFINGAGALNDAMGRLTGIDPNIAEQLFGFYGEVAYRVLPSGLRRTTRRCSSATRTSTRSSRCPTGFAAAAAVRSRRLGGGRHLLGRSRRRHQVRLLARAERERRSSRRRARSTSAWDGGSEHD